MKPLNKKITDSNLSEASEAGCSGSFCGWSISPPAPVDKAPRRDVTDSCAVTRVIKETTPSQCLTSTYCQPAAGGACNSCCDYYVSVCSNGELIMQDKAESLIY